MGNILIGANIFKVIGLIRIDLTNTNLIKYISGVIKFTIEYVGI